MNAENILKIECDCEIIRPIFIKNHYIKTNDLETRKTQKAHAQKIFTNNFSFNEEEKSDFIELIENMNKSTQLSMENEEKEEIDEENALNSEKRKAKYSIIEILNILSQPIINEYSKSRNILKKDISNLNEICENNFNEKDLKDKNDINFSSEKILFYNNIEDSIGLINENSFENQKQC